MPLFGSNNGKVPNTVSNKKQRELARRAARQSWTDRKAVDRRKASEKQRSKSIWS